MARVIADLDSTRVFEEHYTVDEAGVLGDGISGTVCAGAAIKTGKPVAIKIICKVSYVTNQRRIDTTRREVGILRVLSEYPHPHLVHFHDVFETDKDIRLAFELVSGGQLFERVVDLGQYTEADAFTVFHRLVSTLDYLHCLGLLHRDLKPENIMLAGESNTDIRLIDFGISNVTDEEGLCRSQCGTLIYMAPEVIGLDGTPRVYNEKSDLWACGILLFVMLSGAIPFYCDDEQELMELVSRPEESLEFDSEEWEGVSAGAVGVVRTVLVADATLRPDAEALLALPLVARQANTRDDDHAPIDRRRWSRDATARDALAKARAGCCAIGMIGRGAEEEEEHAPQPEQEQLRI